MQNIWINARFLDRPLTGVERVAHELLTALSRDHLDQNGCLRDFPGPARVSLIAPRRGTCASPWPNIALHRAGALAGHAWEQFDLPRLTCGDTLVSLCNTGPILKRRHIAFIHDAQPFAIPENFTFAFGTWYRFLYRTLGRTAARVLVNSNFTRTELERLAGIDANRTRLCPFGVDHVTRITPGPLPEEMKLPSSPFVLAFASAAPNKNFDAILRALDQLGGSAPPCVVVGSASSRVFRGKEASDEKVFQVGRVSDGELASLFGRAICLLFPSFYEGFGLPPLEAMVQGCPVIAANAGALPEVCGKAALYCDPSAPSTLADAIRTLTGDDALRARLVAAGKELVTKYTWAAGAKCLYETMLSLHRNKPTLSSQPTSSAAQKEKEPA